MLQEKTHVTRQIEDSHVPLLVYIIKVLVENAWRLIPSTLTPSLQWFW